MKFIAFLKKDEQKTIDIHEYKRIADDHHYCLFSDSEVISSNFSYYTKNNIHIALLGNIKTRGLKSKDILSLFIEKYLSDGIVFFNTLHGSFIIILWDGEKKVLHVRRDAYGTKLLYYHFSNNSGLAFSNNLDTLLRFTGPQGISKNALHEYLRFLDISPPFTIYENVYFLEPDKILIADQYNIALKDIPSAPGINNKKITLKDAVSEFRNLLNTSIADRIGQIDKAGIFLSGGIDSALLSALASKQVRNLKAYTVGFDDPRFDESDIARSIAEYLKIEHQILKFNIKEDYKAFEDFVSVVPSPFADPAVIPTFQCIKHVSDDVELLIDGTGADTLIGLMPARHIRFILDFSRHIPHRLRLFLSSLLQLNNKCASYVDLFGFQDVEELLIRWKGWSKKEIASLCNENCDLSHTGFYKTFSENSGKNAYDLYSLLTGSLPDDRVHQLSDIFGREILFPFFDYGVQKFVRSLPFELKYDDGVHKILYKKLLEEFIPRSIWDKPKHGFDYPFENLLRYDDSRLLKKYLNKEMIHKQMFFDPLVVEKYLQKFLNGDDTVKFKIWALVVFQAWYANYHCKLFTRPHSLSGSLRELA